MPSHLFFLFLVFLTSTTVSGYNFSDYCHATRCGNITVEYPFYLINDSGKNQSICGYDGFGISCNSTTNTPTFTLPSDLYVVRKIDYSNKLLSLVDTEIHSQNCPAPRYNVSVDANSTLKFDPQNTNFTFLIDCPSFAGHISRFDNFAVSCLGTAAQKSYAIPAQKAALIDRLPNGCSRTVIVPYTGAPRTTAPVGFPSEVKDGFLLDWGRPWRCSRCENSGGCCGYNSTKQFVCFCKDGEHDELCGKRNRNIRLKTVIGVSAGIFGFSVAIVGFFVYRYCARKKRSPSADSLTRSIYSSKTSSPYDHESKSFHQRCGGRVTIFTYKELEEATNSFNPSNELGDGGFGAVYFGKLHDGRKVAVKRLYENNCKRVEQFMNEIEILSGIHHPNLVRLYGCSSRHSRDLLLVYEYINNGTVGDHIHGSRAAEGHLTWKVRLSIAVEIAEALAYLHHLELQIIHRDVKTNNILLDKDFHVKVADFGLSRLFPFDVSHVSTAPQGTPGYVDPDYHKCYQLTDKSDVYSFGVVLSELISSLPAVDIRRHRHEINLANMAINKFHNHELHEFVDSFFGFETDEWVNTTVRAVSELVFRCLAPEREVRPTMEEVAECLRQIQSGGCESEKNAPSQEMETSAVLKSHSATSPKSVTDKWPSDYTTPDNSG